VLFFGAIFWIVKVNPPAFGSVPCWRGRGPYGQDDKLYLIGLYLLGDLGNVVRVENAKSIGEEDDFALVFELFACLDDHLDCDDQGRNRFDYVSMPDRIIINLPIPSPSSVSLTLSRPFKRLKSGSKILA
jgi:hypothetical protein